jgi:hypothetical protein
MRCCLLLIACAACGGAPAPVASAPTSSACDQQWKDRMSTLTIGAPRAPEDVSPEVLGARRLCGERPPIPDKDDRWSLLSSNHLTATAELRLCVSPSGEVQVSITGSSGLPRWDHAIGAAVAAWRFVPVEADGATIAACGPLSIVYKQPPTQFSDDDAFDRDDIIEWFWANPRAHQDRSRWAR